MAIRTVNSCCGNQGGLVEHFIGTAYDVVKSVYDNLGILQYIYDFLNQHGVLVTVDSVDELKALNTDMKYARVYTFSSTAGYGYTDYLYVEGNNSGVVPNDPDATGTWVVVASSSTGGDSGGGTAYIPYVYAQGSALGGETTIAVPNGTVGVPFIIIEGYMNTVGYSFTFDTTTLTVTLTQPLEEGDEVVLLLTGTPAVPDNPNISNWVTINWLYNGGYAVGGEQVIGIPYTFEAIPAIYKNGERYYAGLADKSYTVDAHNQRILLTEPLATNDRLIIQIGGESTTLIMSDRTVQEVARSANVHENEVILSTNTTQYLNGIKVIYDEVAQKSYWLPTLPTNVYIHTVSNGKLTYAPGNIVVDLDEIISGNIAKAAVDTLRADLAANNGSDLIGTIRNNVASAVSRSLTHRLDDYISVKDFGAKGDGTTDDTAAIQAAIDSLKPVAASAIAGGSMFFPRGLYKITDEILIENMPIKLFGEGMYASEIVQYGVAKNGIHFTSNTNSNAPEHDNLAINALQLHDISINKAGGAAASGGIGVLASWGIMTGNSPQFIANNVRVYCYRDAYSSWAGGIQLRNCNGVRIGTLQIFGNPLESQLTAADPYTMRYGINFANDDSSLGLISFFIDKLTIIAAGTGILVQGWHEGFEIVNSEIVQVAYGIIVDGNATHQNPDFFYLNSHIEARVTCAQLGSVFKPKFIGCDLLQVSAVGYDGSILNLNSCDGIAIVGTTLSHQNGTNTAAKVVGIQHTAYHGTITGNSFIGLDQGAVIHGGDNAVGSNVFYGCREGVVLYGAGNTIGPNQYKDCTSTVVVNNTSNQIAQRTFQLPYIASFSNAGNMQGFNVPIPAGVFLKTPQMAIATYGGGASGTILQARYIPASSTATSLHFEVTTSASVAAGTYQFHVQAFESQ